MHQGQIWVSRVHELLGTSVDRQRQACNRQTGDLLALAISVQWNFVLKGAQVKGTNMHSSPQQRIFFDFSHFVG